MARLPIRTRAGSRPGKRLTILDCQVGGHSGVFPITRLDDGRWACPEHGGRDG